MDNKPAIRTKGRYRLKYRGTTCLNCGHMLDISDKYCPNCSQANSTKKLTLKDFFDEFFSSLISYDSKLLKTLSTLLIRPGKITKDFISGKRISYTNPFRFLLSLAIVYFLMLNFSGDFDKFNRYGLNDNNNGNDAIGNIQNINFNDLNNAADQEEALKAMDSIDLAGLINKGLRQKSQKDSIIMADPEKYFSTLKDKSNMNRRFLKMEFFYKLIKENWVYDFEGASEKYHLENTYENRTTFKISNSIVKVIQRPGSFASDLISKLPFLVFFFLPVFTLFISLAYIRKKHNYTDHLIFSFHIQSLLFILLIISFIIDAIFKADSSGIFLFVFSIYLFIAMWKFYGQGVFKTLIKYIYLNTIFFILATISALVLIAISAVTY